MNKTIQKDTHFSLNVQMVQAKMNSYFNLIFYSPFVYKNTRATQQNAIANFEPFEWIVVCTVTRRL